MRHVGFGLTAMFLVLGGAGIVAGQAPPQRAVQIPIDGPPGDPEPGVLMQGGEPGLDQPIHNGRLLGRLLDLPAGERYERLVKWSLPGDETKSIRYYVGTTPKKQASAVFVDRARIPLNEVVSTITVLADAAKEAGKLDELKATADRLADQKLENADLLRILVYLSQGKGKEIEPLLKSYNEAGAQEVDEGSEGDSPASGGTEAWRCGPVSI